MSKPPAKYERSHFEEIMDVLTRAGASQIHRKKLKAGIERLVAQIGIATEDTRKGRLWREVAVDEPSHAELARQFMKAANAKRPLSPDVLPRDLRARLSGMLQNRWSGKWRRQGRNAEPTLSAIEWGQLSNEEQAEIRQMLNDLATYHRTHVRRGRQRKDALDTAVLELADIFLKHTSQEIPRHDLPYNLNSHFIQFAVLVLEPFARYHQTSPEALSRRWERLVKEERQALAEADRDDEE